MHRHCTTCLIRIANLCVGRLDTSQHELHYISCTNILKQICSLLVYSLQSELHYILANFSAPTI
jgi:hypothetical protein